tara:strand:+ start:19195 stop:19317 length:123 start_codon:yes stop_codon:yes gene_type:complete
MENLNLAIVIVATNFIVSMVIVAWCNKRIKELSDPENWKK